MTQVCDWEKLIGLIGFVCVCCSNGVYKCSIPGKTLIWFFR